MTKNFSFYLIVASALLVMVVGFVAGSGIRTSMNLETGPTMAELLIDS